jgi:hypothetical protein
MEKKFLAKKIFLLFLTFCTFFGFLETKFSKAIRVALLRGKKRRNLTKKKCCRILGLAADFLIKILALVT